MFKLKSAAQDVLPYYDANNLVTALKCSSTGFGQSWSRSRIVARYHVQTGLLHLLRWHLLHIAYILVPFNVIAVEKRTVKFSVKEDHKKRRPKPAMSVILYLLKRYPRSLQAKSFSSWVPQQFSTWLRNSRVHWCLFWITMQVTLDLVSQRANIPIWPRPAAWCMCADHLSRRLSLVVTTLSDGYNMSYAERLSRLEADRIVKV